ncbi:MAG: winged helix-turn-helix domain-containing protein [Acidobacteriota bacterium]
MALAVRKTYTFNDFRLDPEARQLSRGAEAVRLTKKPFEVLVYLIENCDRMVTRRELLDTFWHGHDVYEESLTKCIGAIRKGLKDTTENPRFILTHWAEGYRFIGEVAERPRAEGSVVEIKRERIVTLTVEDDDEVSAAIPVARSLNRRTAIWSLRLPLISTAIAVAILATTVLYFARQTDQTGPTVVHSLAVLPLANLTGTESDAYLSDGITESLINSLSRDPELAVVAPGSSFAARDRGLDLLTAAKLMAVESVLTGSLQKDDQILRVAVRVIDGASGRVLWTKEFARPETEIFALQDEVARSSTEAISGKQLTASTPSEYGTADVEAYILYLKGRHLWHSQTEENLTKAIMLFEQAVANDKNFVLAYCGLSDAYNSLGFYFRAPNDVMPKAEEYARQALALDGGSADANFSDASVKYMYRRDLPGTEAAITQVIKLAPRHALAHDLYGEYLMTVGRTEQGLDEIRFATELDPLAHFSNCDLGWQYFNARRFDRSVVQSRTSLESTPSCPFDRLWIGESLAETGKFAEALEALERIDQNYKSDWVPAIAQRAYVYAVSGQPENANKLSRQLERLSKDGYVDPYSIAVVRAGLGDLDGTFLWLDKALDANSYNLVFLRLDPRFDKLRADPRFAQLLSRAHLV